MEQAYDYFDKNKKIIITRERCKQERKIVYIPETQNNNNNNKNRVQSFNLMNISQIQQTNKTKHNRNDWSRFD